MQRFEQAIQLGAIVEALGGELKGDPKTELFVIASIENAPEGSITFVANKKYVPLLSETKAGAVILPEALAFNFDGNAIIVNEPYAYYAKLTQWWKRQLHKQSADGLKTGISPHAMVHPTAIVHESAIVGAGVVIDAHVEIGEGTQIGALSYIGHRVKIGRDCRIAPKVSILDDSQLGDRCQINSGVVIGGDGFGFAPTAHGERRWKKIEQLGAVTIGNDVEIGANTCIDRGAIDNTIIGDGVKLDNVIQIGHNVHIGDDSIIASCTGISGSSHIGERCIIGGAVGMAGHLEVVNDVTIMAATNVTKSIAKAGVYSGIVPFDEANAWRKNAALLKHLSAMRDRIRELELKVSELSKH